MDDFAYLPSLPGTPQEQVWLKERLETLTEWEGTVLTAMIFCQPPAAAADAVRHLLSVDDGAVIAANHYEKLGELQFRTLAGGLPDHGEFYDQLVERVDLYSLGLRYEEEHPGTFVGNFYAVYPKDTIPTYSRQPLIPADNSWSVKLKLASPAKPEGIWLRLPDYTGQEADAGKAGEIDVAMETLDVKSLDECDLLEARCILPEAGNLMEQYSSITELVRDGNNLGYILDGQGQGQAHWIEKFAAALEYEDCHDLKFALDISQNLHCYEWVSSDGLIDFAANHLRSCGASEELLQSCCVDLSGYAEDLLETSGYKLTADRGGYILRNTRQFLSEYRMDKPELPEETNTPQDILNATPLLTAVSFHVTPEEAEAARQSLAKSLAGRGAEGLRQLQAALEYEDCGWLSEAVEIAANLDGYDFVQMNSFQESVKRELMEMGLDEKVIDACFDFGAYAAIDHGFESIYCSDSTGLYVHKNHTMSQPERGGMSMQ